MNEIIYYLIMLIVLLAIFVIIRGFFLWYYKINERISLLERNNQLLAKLVKHFTDEDEKELGKKVVQKGVFINKEV